MTARRSSLLAFGLSLLLTSITASAVDTRAVPGDFNADGRLDALFQPLKPGAKGAIVLQDGTGRLTVVAQDWQPGYLGLDWSADASTLTAADLNGDGQDDVLVQPVKAGGTAALVLTDPTVQLLQISQLLPAGYLGLDWSSATHAVVAGDFDGDHHKELLLLAAKRGTAGALVHADATGHLVALMQSFQDGFLGRRWNAQDEALYVGDFNGDGREDLLVQSRRAIKGESAYALLLADGDGRFTRIAETWNLKDLGADWNPATHKILIEDANHDGIMDITLRSTTGGANYLFEGDTQGLITQSAAHWTGNKSASDVVNKSGARQPGNGISVTVSGPTSDIITGPTNPEQFPTIPKYGQGLGQGDAQGGGTIMTTNAAGTLEGSGGVSGGTATYSIPIIVPPGRAGMQPSVSLSYSSRGGNGSLGMGWSLSAGSEIHRCPATQAMDGYAKGVTYSSTDRLCLDGQHLMLTSGTYGTDGAQYRTELDSFVLVTEHGDMSDSTSHFTVDRKDGHEMRYGWGTNIGNSSNAVFTPSGAPAPLAWGLGMEVDTYSNSIIYYYSTFGAGEFLLTSIKYTGSGAIAGNREVDFTYSTRGDISQQYLAGGLTQQTQVLSTITTYYNGQMVRTYDTDYSSSQATGRTVLKGVQECAGTGTSRLCLPETTFFWHGPTTTFDDPVPMDADGFCSAGNGDADVNNLVWDFSSPGDLNGDGRRDLIMFRSDCGARVYFAQAGGGFGSPISIGSMFKSYLPAGSNATDMDGDGVAEIVGPTSSGWGYTRLNSHGDGFDIVTALPHVGDVNTTPDTDINGDGLPDMVVVEADPDYPGDHRLAVYLNNTGPCSGCTHRTVSISNTATVLHRAPDNSGNASFLGTSLGDMNGDGLPDFELTESNYTDPEATTATWLFVRMDSQGHLSGHVATVTGPVNKGYSLDINGDGLPDKVYKCSATNGDWCYVLNTGNMDDLYTAEVDTGVTDNVDQVDTPGIAPGNVAQGVLEADLDGDGIQELVYPGILMADYCVQEHKGADDMVTQCANAGGSGPDLAPQDDLSIYQYRRTKFAWGPDANGVYKYMPQSAPTTIVAQNNTSMAMDVDGDGLTDIVSAFNKRHTSDTFTIQPGFSDWTKPVGPHYVTNGSSSASSKNAAIDLMVSATNGLGAVTQWNYYPLSSNKTYNGLALYDAPAVGDPDRTSVGNYSYFYFDSSMYVVGDFSTSNGVSASGMREHDFHYGPAIYSSQGRGFQGFRTVVDDDDLTGARTVQVYHQHFPLSGMLKESWITTQATAVDLVNAAPVAGTYIDMTVNTWGCLSRSSMTADGISCTQILDAPTFVPVLQETTVSKYDITSHDLLSTVDTQHCAVSSGVCDGFGYDLYGNSLGSVSTTTDAAGTYTSSVSNTYDPTPDLVDWWVNRLDETVTTVQANYGTSTGALVSRDTTFDYYNDGTRGLNHSYALADGDPSHKITTQYTYTNGNVTSVTVSGGSGATAVAARETETTYVDYFPATVTDPMGLVTTSVYDGRYGKPSSVTAPDGVQTATSYDAFGRVASTQVGSLPAQTVSYITQASGDGMCDGTPHPGQVAYYVLTHQDGYPDHYSCFDMLNRDVRDASESLVSSGDLIYHDTSYDSRGRVVASSEPHYNNASAPVVWNNTSYWADILGRVKTKTDAKGVETDYYYNEDTSVTGSYQQNETRIVTLADGTERDDLEIRNSPGKLLSVSNLTNVPGQTTLTSYAYDSDGNPTTITGPDGSAITASFDILGHKLSVSDPDQGATAYTYDVLGELLTQTDAKAQVLTMTYDADGRMLTKTSSVSGEDPVTWAYDTCTHGQGKVCSVTQGDGSHYQENYAYDSYGRVKTDEEVIEGLPYDTDTSYDADGRVDTVTYPDSITDAAPVASAGGNLYVLPNTDVTLHGSASDPDGGIDPIAYAWTQTSGAAVTLNNPTTLTPDFTVGGYGSAYTFQFTADDGLVGGSDSVTVTVPNLPVAPGGLTDSADTNHDGIYTVAWNTVTDTGTVITYHLEEATGTSSGPTGSWIEIYAGTATSTTVSHPGNSAYYYWYRIRSEAKIGGSSLGFSGYASTQDVIHLVVTPGAPSSISPTIASTSTGSYTITWGAYTGQVVSSKVFYELEESINTDWTGASVVYSGPNRSKSFTKTDFLDYYYRVRACNQDGTLKECSGWTARAHEIVLSTGGGGGQQQIQAPVNGTQAPAPTTNVGMTIPALKPLTDDDLEPEVAFIRHSRESGACGMPQAGGHGRTPRIASGAGCVASNITVASTSQSLLPSGEGQGMRVASLQGHHASPRFAPPVYKAWASAHLATASGGATTARFAVKHVYSSNGYLLQLAEAANPNRIYWQVDQFGGGAGIIDSAGEFYEHGMNAYGQPTNTFSAGGAVHSNYRYDPNTDYLVSINSNDGSGTTYQSLQYQWAAVGNLKNRTSNPNVNSTSVLSEDFHYDLNNRLTSSQVTNGSGTQAAVTYSYDLAGDITCKSDVVSHDCSTTPSGYDYTVTPGVPGGPHAVKTAGSSAYAYDADGNMTSRAGTAITWNSDGLPLSISQDASNNSAFSYAPDKHRYKQVAMAAGVPTTTIYAGGMQIISTGTTTTYEMTLTAYGRSVVMEDLTNSGTNAQGKKSVLLTDNLGSVDTVVDATAMTSQGQSFDSFGRRRNAGSWQSGSGSGTGTSSQHGFTDHEQLDNVGLVHMNGRVYDPTVGRFLSVDPVFQAPTNGQSVNPYSYVMNNPLSMTDPSGYTAVVDNNGGSGPDTAPLQAVTGGGCGTGEGVSACADSLQNGQSTNIVDSNGNVVGTVGKDSSGNLLVTAGNGSNFGQTPQFTTTINGGMVETSGGGVTVGSDSHGGNGAENNTAPTQGGTVETSATGAEGTSQTKIQTPISATGKGYDVVYTFANGDTETRSGGSRAWRNNNPGNVMQSDDDGSIGTAGYEQPKEKKYPIAVYPDEQTGTKALIANLRTAKYQALTVAAAISDWSPKAGGNDPITYAKHVEAWTGLAADAKLNTLTATQLATVAAAIKRQEGWIVGTVTRSNH